MRPAVMLLGVVLIGASPALALEDGASAAQLEEAFAQIRAKVEEQRALTGAAARDAADRLAEIGRLNDRIRDLERENGQLRAQAGEQVALTDAAAKGAADRLAEIDRLNGRVRDLEQENGQLREANQAIGGELATVRGERDRLEREAQELTKAAAARLDEFTRAQSGIAAARAELDAMAQALSELAAQRSVIAEPATGQPSAVELPVLEDPAGLRLELARAQARIEELERQLQ